MSEWKEYKLGEIASFKTGKLNSSAAVENGKYPFFTCSPVTLSLISMSIIRKLFYWQEITQKEILT